MRDLRIICMFALVALLVFGIVGTVFAEGGPSADKLGNGPQMKDERQVFVGNVTDVVGANVTIATLARGSVIVTLIDDTRYKIPGVMNRWDGYDEFISALGGNLLALEGRRVVALAGNVTGTWEALRLMVLPVPGTQPMHAHRTGLVIDKPSMGATTGNITIIDVHGAEHTFAIVEGTIYYPKGIDLGNITADADPPYDSASFVTVVTTCGQNSADLPMAKAIVLHRNTPEDWPKPTPTP